MFCKKCGKELPSNSTFCSQCGEKITKEVVSSSALDTTNSNSKKSSLVAIISVIVGIIIFILAYGISRYSTQEIFSVLLGTSKNENTQSSVYSTNSADSTEAFINETALGLKKGLPVKLDEKTSWVDVTAELNAIRYHYVVSDIDSNLGTNDDILVGLKNDLISSVCNENDTKIFFEKGINLEFSYVVSSTQQSYFVVITRDDCSPIINQNENPIKINESNNLIPPPELTPEVLLNTCFETADKSALSSFIRICMSDKRVNGGDETTCENATAEDAVGFMYASNLRTTLFAGVLNKREIDKADCIKLYTQ